MMRKYTIVLLFLCLLVGTVVSQEKVTQSSLGDSYFPDLGNAGYDALHYHLDITPDFETETLSATVVILIEATQDLSEFNLDFWGYTITELVINGEPADYRRNERELTIIPLQLIVEGEQFFLIISYHGVPREGVPNDRNFPASSGWVFYDEGAMVISEPFGASLWYPVNDYPQDKATYSFEVTVPASYVVATNGLTTEIVAEDDRLTYKSEANDQTASYLVTVHIGDFVFDQSQTQNGLTIRNFLARPHSGLATQLFRETAEMLEFYEGIIGEYPFDVYGSVVLDFELPFALETQTLSTYGTKILEDSVVTDVTLAHELVHQWFGNSVSPARWQDIWLNEGFASYLSLLWAEEKYSKTVFDIILDDWDTQLRDPDFFESSPDAIGNPTPLLMFHRAVYWKGAWVLHALRLRVGNEVFFQIIRDYYQTFRDSHATVEAFVALASAISGEDLSEFFDEWLYQKDIPALRQEG